MKTMSPLLKLDNSKDIKSLLEAPTIAFSEFLTGLLSKSGVFPEAYILSTGKIVQSAIKGKLLTQLGKEFNEFREAGRIKEDYFATNRNQVSLLELLQFIDGDIPDEEVFKAMKSIFFSGITPDADKKKEEISYQFLLVCKQLTSMEILILKTCFGVYKGKFPDVNTGTNSFGDWVNIVSQKIGYDLPELISASDGKLVSLGLLDHRTYSDQSGINPGPNFRLTTLGIRLCEFISEFS